jgi:competence protein ComEC
VSKSKIFMCLSVAFAIGILLGSKFEIQAPWLYGAVAFLICLASSFYKERRLMFVTGLVFMLVVGAWRITVAQQENHYAALFGETINSEGIIIRDIDVRLDKQLLTIKLDGYDQYILVTTNLAQRFAYGDRVWLRGKLIAPENFSNFDYQGYLEKDNVYGLMRYPRIIILKHAQGNWVTEQLLLIKKLFVRQVSAVLEEPYRSLLLGILIGARKTLPGDIVNNFIATGTSHIVAVSGYNMSVIIGALTYLARWLGRKAAVLLSVVLIAGFVIIAGGSASVVRAAVMGVLLLLSFLIGRLYAIGSALCAAGVVMLAINPKILMNDVGFQLSFVATLGIVLFVPLLESLTEAWTKVWKLNSILFTTIAATLATLPIILVTFGRISLVAIAVNLLVLPVIPATMLTGFLSSLPVVGAGFGLMSEGLLWYILAVTRLGAGLPYAAVEVSVPAWLGWLLAMGVGFIYYALRAIKRRMDRQQVGGLSESNKL